MKKIVWISLMMAFLPIGLMAQNANDDLYFIPKKKKENTAKVVVVKEKTPTTVYGSSGSTVVVKDVDGNLRDVDEYNRRYTSRDNSFTMENDTLYIEEKPYNERGEWVNGFEGSQSDYEYAMRIVRFRNPRYAIPVSRPLYWEVVYTLPSWEWNVYNDGFYAYAFPTFTNSLWWDWRYSWNWGWHSPWYYSSWYTPGLWLGSWHHHHYHPHWHHHHPHYGWAGVGGYWGGHGWNGSSARNPGIHAGRYTHNNRIGYATPSKGSAGRVSAPVNRNSRDGYVNGSRQNNVRNDRSVRVSSGREVTAKDGNVSSVRPQRTAVRNQKGENLKDKETTGVRSENVYTRPTEGRGSSYTRQSSTRSTVKNSESSYQRKSGASQRGAYSNSSSSSQRSNNRSSYSNDNSNRSSSRSSYSSGSSNSRSSYSGGSTRSSGGGSSRSGGGRR